MTNDLWKKTFQNIKSMVLKSLWVYSHVALIWLDSLLQEAMLWFKRKRGMKQKQVKACKSLFLFIVKIRFPRSTTSPEGHKPPGLPPGNLPYRPPLCCSLPLPPHLWALHGGVLKGEAHICMLAFSMPATCLIAAAEDCGFYNYKDFPVK